MARGFVYLKIRVSLAILLLVIAITNGTEDEVIQAGRIAIIKKLKLPSDVSASDHKQAQTLADDVNEVDAVASVKRIEKPFSDDLFAYVLRFPCINPKKSDTMDKTVSTYLRKRQTIKDIKNAIGFPSKEYNIKTIGIGAKSDSTRKEDKVTLWVCLTITLGCKKKDATEPNSDAKKNDKSASGWNIIPNFVKKILPFNKKTSFPDDTISSKETPLTNNSRNQPTGSGNSDTSKLRSPDKTSQPVNVTPWTESSRSQITATDNSVTSQSTSPDKHPQPENIPPSIGSSRSQTTSTGNSAISKPNPPDETPQPTKVTPSSASSSIQTTANGNIVLTHPTSPDKTAQPTTVTPSSETSSRQTTATGNTANPRAKSPEKIPKPAIGASSSSSNQTPASDSSVTFKPKSPQENSQKSDGMPPTSTSRDPKTGPGNNVISRRQSHEETPQPSNGTPSLTSSNNPTTIPGNGNISTPKSSAGHQLVFDKKDTTGSLYGTPVVETTKASGGAPSPRSFSAHGASSEPTNNSGPTPSITKYTVFDEADTNLEQFSPFEIQALEASNEYRKHHFAPPLTLSRQLCKVAAGWIIARANGALETHNPNSGCGENIHTRSAGKFSGNVPVDSWYFEKFNYFPRGQEGRGKTGHFTQLVWKGKGNKDWTVGRNDFVEQYFGIAQGEDGNGKILVVANYYPPGNVVGMYESSVSDTNPATEYTSVETVEQIKEEWRKAIRKARH